MRWPLFWETNLSHGMHHGLGRKVAGGQRIHLTWVGILVALIHSVTWPSVCTWNVRWLSDWIFPFLLYFLPRSLCPECCTHWPGPGWRDESNSMIMTHIHYWEIVMIQGKIMTNFSFPWTRNFVPNWCLMVLERKQEVMKNLLPILCS